MKRTVTLAAALSVMIFGAFLWKTGDVLDSLLVTLGWATVVALYVVLTVRIAHARSRWAMLGWVVVASAYGCLLALAARL